MTGLVLPLGHYLGRYHPQAHAPARYHKVRLGRSLVRLGEAAFTVWLLCHGRAEHPGARWTRGDVLDAVRGLWNGVRQPTPDPERLLDSLIDEGVVAEVTPGTEAAIRFAARHRINPLMTGLGNAATEPHRFGIGPLGGPPAVMVDTLGFEVWQWGRLEPDLWRVANRLVVVEDRVNPARKATPEDMLTEVLERLPLLLAHHAAYLDLA
jgi:hypothetical protein